MCIDDIRGLVSALDAGELDLVSFMEAIESRVAVAAPPPDTSSDKDADAHAMLRSAVLHADA